MMVVHLDRLAQYLGATQDEQPYGVSSVVGLRSKNTCPAAPHPSNGSMQLRPLGVFTRF
jgi:hypothetical protein